MRYVFIFLFGLSSTFSKSNEFSKDLLDSLSQKVAQDISNRLVSTKSAFIVNPDLNPICKYYIQNKINSELAKSQSYIAIDTAIISVYNCNIILETISDQDDSLKRIALIDISLNSSKNKSDNLKFKSQISDIVRIKDIEYLNQTLPFGKPIIPSNQNDWGAFRKITEAIVVSASAAVAVVLFFAVRSK